VVRATMDLSARAFSSIQDHIKARTGREPSTGSIYASLDRLEEKGFVKSRRGEPTD
jgi:PadR family transcriptional regulator, regulatory protein PadR